jgi:hypothetical protein
MFRFFKVQSDDAEIQARADSPVQGAPFLTENPENVGDDVLLDSLVSLSKMNGMSVVQHGARLAVMGELLVSVLAHLPVAMRADIVESFRERIEEVMCLGDDRSLPQHYHSALLTEVNRYLNALR